MKYIKNIVAPFQHPGSWKLISINLKPGCLVKYFIFAFLWKFKLVFVSTVASYFYIPNFRLFVSLGVEGEGSDRESFLSFTTLMSRFLVATIQFIDKFRDINNLLSTFCVYFIYWNLLKFIFYRKYRKKCIKSQSIKPKSHRKHVL